MKLQYQIPELDIIIIEGVEVIRTSGGLADGGTDNGTSGKVGLDELFPDLKF